MNTNPGVDKYLIDGCMRCKYGATPQCKVNRWRIELQTLRQLVLASGLLEEVKWSVPCYTHNGKNILMVTAFKEYACISFFKGALLTDAHNILQKHGESSQSARSVRFTSVDQITALDEVLFTYIREAIEIEKTGKKVAFKKNHEPMPEELVQKLEELPELKKAFYALTPGRQRGYILYFSQPVKPESRIKRIEKYMQQILNGQGLNDLYKR